MQEGGKYLGRRFDPLRVVSDRNLPDEHTHQCVQFNISLRVISSSSALDKEPDPASKDLDEKLCSDKKKPALLRGVAHLARIGQIYTLQGRAKEVWHGFYWLKFEYFGP